MKAKSLIVITLLAVLALTLSGPATAQGPQPPAQSYSSREPGTPDTLMSYGYSPTDVPGDNFDSAVPITIFPFQETRDDIYYATVEPDDPQPSCTGSSYGSVWYRFDAPISGQIDASLSIQLSFGLAAYTGSRGSLQELACAYQDSVEAISVSFHIIQNQTYYIEVICGGFCLGSITFTVNQPLPSPAPQDDDFDHAAALDEPPPNGWANQVLETDTNSATVAPDDPDMGCGAGVNSHTIWYKLTPSYYGRVRLSTYSELAAGNSTYDTVLAVFTGQRGSLQRIACNDDAPDHGTLSELTFEAEAEQTYYIEVASYGDSPGGTLSLFYNYQVSPKAWTLMFYIAANNDLKEFLLQERESLRLAARNLNVNILALWDDNMNLFGSKYMVFAPWGVQEISKPELNTGDPQTLRDFVTWAMQEYPANHYALIISNHGQGFSGTSIDGFSHGDWLTVKETYQALLGIYPRLDIIYMHACLMATLDSAYQLADQADYYIASESQGWVPIRYDYFITGMPEHRTEVSAIRSDTSPTELALAMAESYAYQMKFTPQGQTPSTISVIKLSEITDVAVAASDLAGLLKNRMGTVKTALNSIWEDVQRFDESWPQWEINTADRAADLYHFASLVSQRISDAEIQGAAWNLMNKISAAVLFNEAWSGYPSGGGNAYWYHGDAHGISVFLPSGKKQCYYTGDWLDFAYGTDWGCQGATSIVGSSWITGTPFEWGPMLVEYFNQTNPSAPEELNPPEPVPLLTYHNVYLPLVLRSFGVTPPPTPTPTPTPPPSGPSIRVEPTSGTFGTQFTIYGSGFTPGESVQQWVITPSGDRFDDPTPETVDSQGNYTSWVRIDSGPTGTYTLYARGNQSQQTVSAQFQITSSTGGLGTSRTINVLWK